MAVRLLANEVSDLCLGKPPLRCLSVSSATVADAIAALRRSPNGCISVWSCNYSSAGASFPSAGNCRCVGKLSLVGIACFLCKEENFDSPSAALNSPVDAVIPKVPGLVRHLDPHSSLLEAIELVLDGAQNLVVPIVSGSNPRKKILQKQDSTFHGSHQYCWLTQEDIIRFLLDSISHLCPTPFLPINTLGVIHTDSIHAIHYYAPASSILPLVSESHLTQTGIAIVDSDRKWIGEINPLNLNFCDLAISVAIKTLSAGELMAHIDSGAPPEDFIRNVKHRLDEKNLGKLSEFIDTEDSDWSSSSCSSDEEFGPRSGRCGAYHSTRMARRSEATVCNPSSSLVAVMIQAIAHRVNYAWVVEEDGSLAGIVTFASMLKVFRERMKSMA